MKTWLFQEMCMCLWKKESTRSSPDYYKFKIQTAYNAEDTVHLKATDGFCMEVK